MTVRPSHRRAADSHQLYRHNDKCGTLLYVGVSCNFMQRLKKHKVPDGFIFDLGDASRGERDKKFWPHVARQAHFAKSLDELIAIAREMNEMMAEPWTDNEAHSEIVKRCKYWWDKTQKGENWFGVGKYVRADHSLVDDLMMRDPDAFTLLMFLRRHHWGRDFPLANETCTLMPGGGWRRQRFTAARASLIESGYLEVVSPATRWPRRAMVLRLAKNGHL
jgi:hypothetical protein